MKKDFHMHSCHSDGSLSGKQLVELASQRRVGMMSITDHDSLSVYDELSEYDSLELELIVGCEFSSVWNGVNVHVVGLNLDRQSPVLGKAIELQQRARDLRAQRIAEVIEKKGLPGAMDGATKIANGAVLGRPHFAQFMVDKGFVKDRKQAFKKYLGAGKVGDIKAQWPDVGKVCQWIIQSGGVPVLAHPLKYGLTQTKLKKLMGDFREAGGLSIEVISGHQDRAKTKMLGDLACQYSFHASLGSDFHQPGQSWADLGMIPELPSSCRGVWELWQ